MCGGKCPTNQVCRTIPGTTSCGCQDIQLLCDQSPAPQCGGLCPSDQTCRPDPLTGQCHCIDTPVPCDQSPFPSCGGECPAGFTCEANTATGVCGCEPVPPPCEQSPFPQCGGTCPVGQECLGLPSGLCGCVGIIQDCGQSAPGCGGFCPQGQLCTPDPVGCHCATPPVPCSSAGAPLCNGICPPDFACINFHSHCYCIGCISTDPGPTGGTSWTNSTTLIWAPSACASSYNVYRNTLGLLDSDGDGVADSYGSCFVSDVSGLQTSDSSMPQAGRMFLYAISGENLNGEGSLGYASNDLIRPTPAPCP
jgi:hypothetical protein